MENLAGMIRKAGKTQRTSEFLCPYLDEVFISLTYVNKVVLLIIRDASLDIRFNKVTKEREEGINEDKLRVEYVNQVIRGWRGMTARKLKKLIPGLDCAEEDLDKDVAFDRDTALALLEGSVDFEGWIINTATQTENYVEIEEKKNTEFENLEQ